jgi:hypothetical protein
MPTSFAIDNVRFELHPITLADVRNVRSATGVPLTTCLFPQDVNQAPMLNRIAEETPDLFIDLLWQLCKRQAQQGRMRRERFVEALSGSTIADDALKALAGAIPFFFHCPDRNAAALACADVAGKIVDERRERIRNFADKLAAARDSERAAASEPPAATLPPSSGSATSSPDASASNPGGTPTASCGPPSAPSGTTTPI